MKFQGILSGVLIISLLASVLVSSGTGLADSHIIADSSDYDLFSYFGGNGSEYIWETSGALAVDYDGSFAITGETSSDNLPVTENAAQAVYAGGRDAFVARFNESGDLEYCSYLGGSGREVATAVTVDGLGYLYLLGHTSSTDFHTERSIQATNNGLDDMYITIIAPNGSIIFSSYYGGSGNDWATGISLDFCGNMLIVGSTQSEDFPVKSAFQSDFGGGTSDGFVIKIKTDLTVRFASFYGGDGNDGLHGVTQSLDNNIIVSGHTASSDLTLVQPLQAVYGGDGDAMIAKVNRSGSSLLFSSYFGGSGNDYGRGVVVDLNGGITMVGSTESADLAASSNAFQPTIGGGTDGYIIRFCDNNFTIRFCSFIGASDDDAAFDVSISLDKGIYITGETSSPAFPTKYPLRENMSGSTDAYLMWVSLNGTNLLQSTFIGGSATDYAAGIEVDFMGRILIVGSTTSPDLEVDNPFQSELRGERDIFIIRVELTGTGPTIPIPANEEFPLTLGILASIAGVTAIAIVIAVRKRI